MRNSAFYVILSFLLFSVCPCLLPSVKAQVGPIQDIFTKPPESAKPRGYWLWPHGNFDYSRIVEELKAYKEMGLGGMDIFDMGIADGLEQIPAGNTFMGQAMMDGVVFADSVAKELDIALGLSVSNGWNAGGDWTPPDEMIMRLLFWKDTLQGPVQISEIGFPEIPTTFVKPYGSFELYPRFGADGFPEFYQNVALVAYPLKEDSVIRDPEQVIYFDEEKIDGNRMDLELPAGEWVLARAVVSPLGQRMWMRSDNSDGWIMDHYSKKATKHHFEHIIAQLEDRLGDLRESALERLYLASFEAEDYIIWSPEVKKSFFQQHGYELDPYLPILAGQSMVNEEISRRFLHDYRSTISEMFVNNHYRQGRDISNRHGLLLASESGGPGPPLHYVPTEDMKALGSVNVMRGEFWNKESEHFDEHGNDLLQVVKNIGSAAHIYGHKVVEMEAFTSHLKHWQETPFELKKLADKAFCEGMTRVMYHTMAHSPKEAGVPGWSYQAGTHISPKMAWWSLSKPFHDYIARTSAMLQQGLFVADVAYYYGEEIPNFASGTKYIRASLGHGYEYDDLNKEILLQSRVDEEGRVVLPSGMAYRLLVLPDEPAMSLEVLNKIEQLLQDGATVLGPPPTRVPGLKDFKSKEVELKDLVEKIWGAEKGDANRSYGEGRMITGVDEREVLQAQGILPDLMATTDQGVQLDFIHRSTGSGEIYFIRNPDSLGIRTDIDFRVSGKQPYLFDPVTGYIKALSEYKFSNDRTQVKLSLEPFGSMFVVFSGELKDNEEISNALTLNENASPIELTGPWQVHFPQGWGFTPIQTFDELVDWKEHSDPELSIFSGTATYNISFEVDDPAQEYRLDLGEVGVAARVFLNGHEIGTRVFPPYQLTINGIVREGRNNLVIEVASTWLNQLIGEAKKPILQQRTSSNLGSFVDAADAPDGQGKTYSQRPWQDYEPQASGLIGPVRLLEMRYLETEKK